MLMWTTTNFIFGFWFDFIPPCAQFVLLLLTAFVKVFAGQFADSRNNSHLKTRRIQNEASEKGKFAIF